MKIGNFLGSFLILSLLAFSALAANVAVESPIGVWDNSTGKLVGFSSGPGSQGYTAIQVSGTAYSLPNGTVALPSLSFTSDPDTGLYRIGANNLGIAASGAKVLDVGTAGLGVTGTLSSTSDFAVATNKFTVAGTSGNTVTSGTSSHADNLIMTVAAKGLVLKQGANGRVGTFTCTSGGSITVNNSGIAVADAVIISLNTLGGSISAPPFLTAITAATSFVAKCATSDTSVYNYALIGNAS